MLQSIWTNIVAGMGGFHTEQPCEVVGGGRADVCVRF
jgi:hypothetical protein